MKTTTTRKRRKLDLSEDQKAATKKRREGLRVLATSVRDMGEVAIEKEASKSGLIPSITGRDLSPFNTVFVLRQRPTATQVGGFKQWKKAGRKVKKGSKAVAIWLPITKKGEQENGEEKEETRFRTVNVFDVADTERIESK